MTRPETCDAAGGAISLWVNIIDCPGYVGIISSYGPAVSISITGTLIQCTSGDVW